MDTATTLSVLLVEQHENLPLFAAVPLFERWNNVLSQLDTHIAFSKKSVEFPSISAEDDTAEQFLVLFSDWIVDDVTVETAVELAGEIKESEVLFFRKEDSLAPLFIAGKEALKILKTGAVSHDKESVLNIESIFNKSEDVSVTYNDLSQGFWGHVSDEQSARDAEWGLLQFLQFRPGGIVAKYLNRPFSIRMTRHLLKYKWITPNVVTIADFFFGLLALSFFLIPHYWAAVVATILLQINSIIDGVDGEIARLRKETSVLGANLDSFSDETVDALIYPSIGYYLMITGYSPWFLAVGVATGVISYTYAMINFHSRFKSDKNIGFYYWWDQKKPIKTLRRKPTIAFYLKHLLWRESILFGLMFIALFGVLDYFVLFAFIPALVNAVLVFIHIFVKKAPW